MAGPDAQRIGAVIPNLLRRVEQQHQTLFAVQARWDRLVGKRLAAHTKPVSLRHGRLVVVVDHPGDGFALSYQRSQLLERLQTATNGKVQEIVIRPGTVNRETRNVSATKRGRFADQHGGKRVT